jgi:hypothetical protein
MRGHILDGWQATIFIFSMNAIVDVLGLRLQHHMTVTMRVRSRVYVMRLYLAIWAGSKHDKFALAWKLVDRAGPRLVVPGIAQPVRPGPVVGPVSPAWHVNKNDIKYFYYSM